MKCEGALKSLATLDPLSKDIIFKSATEFGPTSCTVTKTYTSNPGTLYEIVTATKITV